MNPIISPRELAAAIGVSESSLKRWADEGKIRVSRTAGGHRRIAIGEAIRFVRTLGAPLVQPDLLGLRDLSAVGEALLSAESPSDRLFNFLAEGKAKDVRGLILSLYLGGHSVADIADGPIRIAMERLGELWKHDQAGVFVEHRATDICVQAVEQLRQLVEPDTPSAVAVGGAPSGDPYLLPSLLIATALEAEGWRAVNLGPNTPFDSLLLACEHHKPVLAWVTVTSIQDATEFERGWDRFVGQLAGRGATIAVGGQALPSSLPLGPASVRRCETIAQLINLAETLSNSITRNSQIV